MRKTNNIITISLIVILSISICSISYGISDSYIWSLDTDPATPVSSNIVNSSDIVNVSTESQNENTLNLESGSAVLIEQSTGQVLFSHNEHEQLRPASVTKVMIFY